jgi:hypothetical protein
VPSFGEAMSLLPWRDRWFLYFLLACAAAPLVLVVHASLPVADSRSIAFALGSRPWLAGALALAAATAGLLGWERPVSWGLRAYGAQLRARVLRLQAERDAEFRRRYSHSEGAADEGSVP